MEHLLNPNPSVNKQECEGLAAKLQLKEFSTDPTGIGRLARLANILEANPKIVNPDITTEDQAFYF
jgi:hypothetical protein